MTVATVTVTGATRAQAKGSDVTGDRVAGADFPHIATLQAFDKKLEEKPTGEFWNLPTCAMFTSVAVVTYSTLMVSPTAVLMSQHVLQEKRRRYPVVGMKGTKFHVP